MHCLRAVLALSAFALLAPAAALGTERSQGEGITADALRSHIFFLASDSLGGRHVGSDGLEIAYRYAESEFAAAGLKPLATDGGHGAYRMEVPLVRRLITGGPAALVETPAGRNVFAHGNDFKWFLGDMIVCEGKRLEMVYVGYGISEPGCGWDDLEGLDLEGKAVLFLPGAPMENGAPVLPQGIHERYARIQSLMKKIHPLLARRAAALLLIADQEITEMWDAIPSAVGEPYIAYGNSSFDAMHLGCLCVLRPEMARTMFVGQPKASTGAGVGVPVTTDGFDLDGAFLTLSATFTDEAVPAWNIVGTVDGCDPVLKDDYVVVTAHLDTNPPEDGEVMNGADDNASGCAGLIEIARAVAVSRPRRSVVCALLTGEEGGVVGSRHFVSCPPVPLDRIRADVNLDGIGRSDPEEIERTQFVLDSDKITPSLRQLIIDVNARTIGWPLKFDYRMGDSDHLMFHAAGIPAVNFYAGHHDDVNKATDDPDKIDFEKAEKISRLVYEVTMELADRESLWD